MKKFTYKSKYGEYTGCYFTSNRYADKNRNLAVSIMSDEEGIIAHVTVNTDKNLPDDMIAIKDYSENEGMVESMIDLGCIEVEAVGCIYSGYVVIPVHRLTEKGKLMMGVE